MTARKSGIAFLMVFSAMFACSLAAAQSYPAKPIRLVVPFPPGGPADLLARVISEKMSSQFGQAVIVDNRPGANSVIAAELVAKASPDGYTLLMAIDSTLAMNQHLYATLRYDPVKDFTPVALIATVPVVLLAANSTPANNVKELIALAKAKPGDLNFGAGTINTQLMGELFNTMAGIKMGYVPYKGGATTITALMSGEVPVIFDGPNTAIPYVKTGKAKALGVTSARRLSQLPEVPTIAESGLPGYDVVVWQSIVAPAGTPRGVVDKLNAELGRIMNLADVRERLQVAGIEPTHSTPQALADFARSESAKWGKVIKDIGLKLD